MVYKYVFILKKPERPEFDVALTKVQGQNARIKTQLFFVFSWFAITY